MSGPFAIEVTAENFQREVVERSATTPVLLDFWAEWCGPCKTLGPVLEQIAEEFGGSFVLGKVDTEKERDLAYAFQVQGIPFCVLVDGGRPVDAFQGALRETEVRRFLQRNAIGPAAAKEPAAAEEAPAAVDPTSPAARLDRALLAASQGDAAAVRRELDRFPEEDEGADRAARLLDAIAFLEAPLPANATGAAARLVEARAALLQRDIEGAMEQMLASVAEDKTFGGGLARKGMLLCFQFLDENDERVDDYRRRLATLLY